MSTASNGQRPQPACGADKVAPGIDPRPRHKPLDPHDRARPPAGRVR
ncbi:hypothetical protein ACIBF6_26630 [Streptosporangium amethystogenes]